MPPPANHPIATSSWIDLHHQRVQEVKEGVFLLNSWLEAAIRQGMADLVSQPESFWTSFASLLVDAKLGPIAKRIRHLAWIARSDDWPDKILECLGELYLFVKGFGQLESLSEPWQREILYFGGVTMKKEELVTEPVYSGFWRVIGVTYSEEDQLTARRTWLAHCPSGRMALLLDFTWGKADFAYHLTTGTHLEASIVYYPANHQQRAIIKEFRAVESNIPLPIGHESWNSFSNQYQLGRSLNPWLTSFAGIVDRVVPVFKDGRQWLVDQTCMGIMLTPDSDLFWEWVACSGGYPIQGAVEWQEGETTLLSCWKTA